MADVIFILGAGCSAHAHTPVMANFLDSARDIYQMKKIGEHAGDFDTVFKVVTHLQQVHSKAQLDIQNIESVFSAVDLGRTLRKLPGFEADQIDGVLASLVWFIVRTIEETTLFESANGDVWVGANQWAGTSEAAQTQSPLDWRSRVAIFVFASFIRSWNFFVISPIEIA